jgi:hypothetical protein
VLHVRGGKILPVALPSRDGGGEVGDIQAVIGDGHVFGVVTAETDDSNGGAELWRSIDGTAWTSPTVLPLGGDVHALAHGPYGMLVVGSRRGKQASATRARALFLGLDEQATVYTSGVNDKPGLLVAVCGAGREAWGAGEGLVLHFDRGAAVAEKIETRESPVAMGLDMVGVPWLVTERAVLRRHVDNNEGVWRPYYARDAGRAPLIGIGFTPDGVALLDARGASIELEPHDIEYWRARASSSPSPARSSARPL